MLSIHKGFRGSGLALGPSRRETIRHVILPLAPRRMPPPLGNQWIGSARDTSLFIVTASPNWTRQEIIRQIGRAESERRSRDPSDYHPVPSFILRRLERRMKNPVIEFKKRLQDLLVRPATRYL